MPAGYVVRAGRVGVFEITVVSRWRDVVISAGPRFGSRYGDESIDEFNG
jgi:hypothetical protein